MTASEPVVLVAGDLTISHDIYRGDANATRGGEGSQAVTRRQGAAHLFQLLNELGGNGDRYSVTFGHSGHRLCRNDFTNTLFGPPGLQTGTRNGYGGQNSG